MATGVLISSCLVLTSAHSFFAIDENNSEATKSFTPQLFYIDVEAALEERKAAKILGYKINRKYVEVIEKIK